MSEVVPRIVVRESEIPDIATRLLVAEALHRRGNCYDKAAVESFFGTFKAELAEDFESAADAKVQAFDCRNFYNQQRMHSALGHESPSRLRTARADEPRGRIQRLAMNRETQKLIIALHHHGRLRFAAVA